MWVLGIELRSFERDTYALTAEPCLQGFIPVPQVRFLLILACFARSKWRFLFLHVTSPDLGTCVANSLYLPWSLHPVAL